MDAFKEFSYTFEPNYDTGEIVLNSNFFREVNDGNVLLKFHFWSGAVVEYTLTKEGASMMGTAAGV
nr:hypothetical protein [Cohnella algarum]